ncbi:haloacid dehalogenase [Natrinema pellirubrum DSM 15624]|uniref:Haloacid dehalogenase n=1 Tax=Natrinema pellirubrum (strain DSM 15624 / CIP 106293 / JCM 10476 / NCIMB 786 / 157) TaxID=797303 RepID=L0JI27_NATP1|nr:HAD family hydrolase [Natrinema pellirubrum]AGB30498.1 putative phosphatase [Natrinema pellirubrum DSM 15624]ELY77266.1 haloacid dehalogenase [Natrinema pellirubrum DSM 15624]
MTLDHDYDFWLLDLDGTLVDVEWSYTRGVFDRVGDRLGREFSDRQAEIIWNGLTGSRDRQLEAWGVDPDAFWTAFHEEEDPIERAERTYLHEDAAVVGDLEVPVGLVTHCQEFLTEPVLDHLDIHDWFDARLCCTEETGWKPDPTPVERVMNDLGVGHNGHRGVLAGDGACDVGAAWNAGLDAIHVERVGHEQRGRCVLGDHRVTSFDELY